MRKISKQFNDKDYGEYFSALQNNLERKSQSLQQPITISKNTKKSHSGVIKLKPKVYITAILLVVVLVMVIAIPKSKKTQPETSEQIQRPDRTVSDTKIDTQQAKYFAEFTDDTAKIDSDIKSQNVIVINCDTNKVVVAHNATERCYPASTTKIMTILTACDYITDYNDTFTFSYEITDPFFKEDASMAGFADGEAVTMTDMLYGAILPSGADATAGIAISIAGSEEAFVKLMNQKAQKMGLKDTHFTNLSGLHDENHYTTAEDMAVIVRYAMQDELCRKILSTYQYTTTPTKQHPDGIPLSSTLFNHMYGTEPEGARILGGKTGYVNESGYCIASFGKSDSGAEYVCVTLKGDGLWPTMFDQINLYTRYAK